MECRVLRPCQRRPWLGDPHTGVLPHLLGESATGGAYPDEVIEGLEALDARLAALEGLTARLITWATERTARELAEHKQVMAVLGMIAETAGVSPDELPRTIT